jgi:hypothetical protein
MVLRRRLLFFSLFLSSSWMVLAQDEPYLYIVTRPLGAKVVLNGKTMDRPAPLLLRKLAPGSYHIRIEKDGWFSYETRVSIPEQNQVEVVLVPKAPLVYLDGNEALAEKNGKPTAPGESAFRFPSGSLILSAGRNGVAVAPVFGKQKLLDGVKFALPLFLALTGVLTIREIYAPRESGFVLAPELAASSLIGGGLLVWNITLETERNRFLRNYRTQDESWKALSLAGRLRFQAADEALLGGNFDSALAQFRSLILEYPDDPIMPHALFEIGRILFIKDDIDGAATAYRTIAENYPLPDLHDRSRKALADCLFAQGDTNGALEQLELLSFNGSGLTREEVQMYRDLY